MIYELFLSLPKSFKKSYHNNCKKMRISSNCQKRELCTFDNNNKKAASNKCKTTISNVGMKYAREECGGTKLN